MRLIVTLIAFLLVTPCLAGVTSEIAQFQTSLVITKCPQPLTHPFNFSGCGPIEPKFEQMKILLKKTNDSEILAGTHEFTVRESENYYIISIAITKNSKNPLTYRLSFTFWIFDLLSESYDYGGDSIIKVKDLSELNDSSFSPHIVNEKNYFYIPRLFIKR